MCGDYFRVADTRKVGRPVTAIAFVDNLSRLTTIAFRARLGSFITLSAKAAAMTKK